MGHRTINQPTILIRLPTRIVVRRFMPSTQSNVGHICAPVGGGEMLSAALPAAVEKI
jgi:hypothetical protein